LNVYGTKNNNKLLDEALSVFLHGSEASLLSFLNKLVTSSEAEEIAQEAYLKLYLYFLIGCKEIRRINKRILNYLKFGLAVPA